MQRWGTGGENRSRYFRPAEVENLMDDPTKTKQKMGWTQATTLEELEAEMVAIATVQEED